MTWTDPRWLWAVAASPAVAFVLDVAARKSRAAVRLLDPTFPPRRRARALLPAAAVALTGAALAGPQWGSHRISTVSPESDVVVVLDTSGSMLARDAAPDRFTQARLFARQYFRRLPETVRTAVVRVEGEADVVSPLTLDRAASENAVADLVPRGTDSPGSNLGGGVRQALLMLASRPSRAKSIVLVSDGEDLDAGLRDAAAECRRRGVVLDTVAVGSAAGAPVPGRDGAVLTDGGAPVISRADPGQLDKLARECGGKFAALGASGDAAAALAAPRKVVPGAAARSSREPVSRSAWPLAAAITAWTLWWLPRGESA